MNPSVFNHALPIEDLVGLCNLSPAEQKSLALCPSSSTWRPEAGNRTAYVSATLHWLSLVRPLYCVDHAAGEIFFTWQRTPPGDRLAEYYREGGA